MTDRSDPKDPLEYGSVEEWAEFGEQMEPDWDKAHKPRLKSEVLTIRLSAADAAKLKAVAEDMGIGHSTLARMILRRALHAGAGTEEAAVLVVGADAGSLGIDPPNKGIQRTP